MISFINLSSKPSWSVPLDKCSGTWPFYIKEISKSILLVWKLPENAFAALRVAIVFARETVNLLSIKSFKGYELMAQMNAIHLVS